MSDKTYDPYHFREANLAPTDVKRQHSVARNYLRRFGADGQVGVYDLNEGRAFPASVDNIAVEARYYNVEYEDASLSTETWLAEEVESPFWPLLDRLCDRVRSILDLHEREEMIIARYIAAQRLRVPSHRLLVERKRKETRDWMADMVSRATKRDIEPEEVDAHVSGPPQLAWLKDKQTYQAAEVVSMDLGEITGDANMLRAMPWRIGRVHHELQLYTSDDPVAAHLPAVLPEWWSEFEDAEYFFPLSPATLLEIGPIPRAELQTRGRRTANDFSKWETSRARAVVSQNATRWLFGDGPYVDRKLARRNVEAFDSVSHSAAIEFHGYDPNKIQRIPSEIIKITPPGFPRI